METPPYKVIRAVHPHWSGELTLSQTDDSVRHGHHSSGVYELSGKLLVVKWHKYGTEIFHQFGDIFVHEKLLCSAPDLERTPLVSIGARPLLAKRFSVMLPGQDYDVTLRANTSDITLFKYIFANHEYDSPCLPCEATSIVDVGANIGLVTVFFALKYPGARILAVEPEEDNYKLMLENISALGPRVQSSKAAAWIHDGFVNLHTETEDGAHLGAWGFQVSEKSSPTSHSTQCFTIKTLLDAAGLQTVDILKIDIEGSELELFSQSTEGWLSKTRLIIIETHERFRPGSDAAVRNAPRPDFRERPGFGDNLIFERIIA